MCQIGENLEKENLKWRKSKLGASRKEIRSGRAYGIDALLHHSPPPVTIIQIGLIFFGWFTCLKLQDNSKVFLTQIPKIIQFYLFDIRKTVSLARALSFDNWSRFLCYFVISILKCSEVPSGGQEAVSSQTRNGFLSEQPLNFNGLRETSKSGRRWTENWEGFL